jgi:hypothetical protein
MTPRKRIYNPRLLNKVEPLANGCVPRECTAAEVQQIEQLLATHNQELVQPTERLAMLDRILSGGLRRLDDLDRLTQWFECLRDLNDETKAADALVDCIQNYWPTLRRHLQQAGSNQTDRIEEALKETWEYLWRKRERWPAGEAGARKLLAVARHKLRSRVLRSNPRPLSDPPPTASATKPMPTSAQQKQSEESCESRTCECCPPWSTDELGGPTNRDRSMTSCHTA